MGNAPGLLGLVLVILVLLFSTCTWIGNRYSIAPDHNPPTYQAPDHMRPLDWQD